MSTTLITRVYCRDRHLIGERTLDLLKLSRNEGQHLLQHSYIPTHVPVDVIVAIHDSLKTPAPNVLGHLILRLQVSWSVRFSKAVSPTEMEAMRYLEILNTISTEQLRRLSDNWKRFLSSFSGVIVEAKYIAQVCKFDFFYSSTLTT